VSDEVSQPTHERINLVRANYPSVELRANEDDVAGMPMLVGELAVFNQPTEINSVWEGRFIEILEPGAFTKTISENRDRMRILFQHGQDPQIGDKPLAQIEELEQDADRVRYAGRLLDTSYNRDLVPGLDAGLYGSSFRFDVIQEHWTDKPTRSSFNPEGLPERRVREVRLHEFGPVTFPAYPGASAGVRSLTDQFLVRDARFKALLEASQPSALPGDGAGDDSHSDEGSRVVAAYPPIPLEAFLEKLTNGAGES
jgi:HK97 family phage prohead protease